MRTNEERLRDPLPGTGYQIHPVERLAAAVRHSRPLQNSLILWDLVRPWYERFLKVLMRPGLRRMINGTDLILLEHDLHGIPEVYEPAMWVALMDRLMPGDTVADVGAYIGLYSVAMANRVGAKGRVYAFEPDPESYSRLCRHIELNRLRDRVRTFPYAVGAETTLLRFAAGQGSESTVVQTSGPDAGRIESVHLDSVFAHERLDVLKIDVEGYEQHVLRGAVELLCDEARAPRAIFVEVHPLAWEAFGVTDRSLLTFLWQCGYRACDLTGEDMEAIDEYGVILAHRDVIQ